MRPVHAAFCLTLTVVVSLRIQPATSDIADDVCHLQKYVGPCRGLKPRYYFDLNEGQCNLFTYGGCDGNGNNFHSQAECERICRKFIATTPPPPPVNRCEGDGSWNDGCNTCTCVDGGAACTRRLCDDIDETRVGECEGNVGWHNGCNWCNCINGRGACTRNYCGIDVSQLVTSRATRDVAVNRCNGDGSWNDGCNTCTCVNGGAACSRRFCDNIDENRVGECDGNVGWHDGCNWCNCINGRGACTRNYCGVDVSQLVTSRGTRAVQQCTPGASWTENCNSCHCSSDGVPYCTLIACEGAPSFSDSETLAPDDVCLLPPFRGDRVCLAYIPMWTYSSTEGRCVRYIYGGCGGTQNLFDTETQCIDRCPIGQVARDQLPLTEPVDVCGLSIDAGPCFAYKPRFGYNQVTGQCESFTYGGCAGNGNRFLTYADCLNTCGRNNVSTNRKK